MFSIKIFNKKENRNQEFGKTINNLVSFIYERLNLSESRVVSDSSCIEIVSGKENISDSNEIVVELLIKKYIVIDKSELNDKRKMDEYITKIKHFCEQAKNIETQKYVPINMRLIK